MPTTSACAWSSPEPGIDVAVGHFPRFNACPTTHDPGMPYSEFRTATAEHPQPLFFVGGFTLTFLAGAINVAMLSRYAVPVAHMSGAVSRLGMDLGTGKDDDLMVIGLIIVGFALGCVFTGALVGSNLLAARRRYAVVLACEALVIALAAWLQDSAVHAAVILGATACGIQNAMASSFYGLVVRTTHVTGIITDLGFMIGATLSGRRFPLWKPLLLVLLVTGYLAGGISAAALAPIFPGLVLWGCCALAVAIAVGCLFLPHDKDHLFGADHAGKQTGH
jgi:uncharacterized membrane protein YoaK (UPF0700 family)